MLTEPIVVDGESGVVIAGAAPGAVLKASGKFRGRALIYVKGSARVTIKDLTLDGARGALEKPVELPPSNETFAAFYQNNGIVAEDVTGFAIENVRLRNVANYPVIVTRAHQVRILRVQITDSGSRNAKGRNNGSGGILLEEGTRDFVVRNCKLARIRGNGIWTHSNYTSPRNADGLIEENDIRDLARDAIQVGHATNIRVERNTGARIGWPIAEVDVENEAWPVAIDTAGNVDKSVYAFNTFEELNGKCIDLDGFHHGEIRRNRCVNAKPVSAYPHGQFGIVMNNNNPDMKSEHITIVDNELEGMKYGGIYVIGRHHRIEKNRMRFLNIAGCNEAHSARVACFFDKDEPDFLRSGIYFGRYGRRVELPEENIVNDNLIMGHGMKEFCLGFAPGVAREKNQLERNICLNPPAPAAKKR